MGQQAVAQPQQPQPPDASAAPTPLLTSSPAAPPPATRARRLWRARGFIGGIAAIVLAWFGEQAILVERDDASAWRWFIAAALLLALSLFYPAISFTRRRSRDIPPIASEAQPAPTIHAADLEEPIARVPARSTSTEALEGTEHSPRAGASISPPGGREPAALAAKPSLVARWEGTRRRWGARFTSAGVMVALLLAGAAAWVLQENLASPLGGWLWFGSLLALVLTFVGRGGWNEGESPFPGWKDDFFGQGAPRISVRWEAALAALMMALGLALRLYALETHPVFFGDEGEQGLEGRAILEGQARSFFGVGWWDIPNMPFYLWAAIFRVAGDDIVGVRLFSVVGGMVMLLYVYRIGRLLWGPRAGLIAGTLLAVSPLALQFSRVANVNAATGALLAAGFFYFFMALRYGRGTDWVLSGLLWSLNLYFYPAGKMIIPLVGVIGLYCLVRWRLAFFKRYLAGFLLSGAAFLLAFMPYFIFSAKDNWHSFTRRSQETFIFSPSNQFRIFASQGVPYDFTWATKPLLENVLSDPAPWAQVMSAQIKVTTESLYRRGDAGYFYKITEHDGSLFAPLLAGVVLLSIFYALLNFWDARFMIVSMWFWSGMLVVAITGETPNAIRLVIAWAAIMLLPAALLDRILSSAWPLSKRLARAWTAVPLAGLLLVVGISSASEYFGHYSTLCPPYWHIEACESDAQARYVKALSPWYRVFALTPTENIPAFGFNYISTRFIAKGADGRDVRTTADLFPVTDDNGKGIAFLVYTPQYSYLRLLRSYYPNGVEEKVVTAEGRERFTVYRVEKEDVAAFHTVNATFSSTGDAGMTVARATPHIGTILPNGTRWQPPLGLSYPMRATWWGGLVAPAYGSFSFSIVGDATSTLVIDGQPVLTTQGVGENRAMIMLAAGPHSIELASTLADSTKAVQLRWSGPGAPAEEGPISPQFLFNGPTGGLAADFAPLVTLDIGVVEDPLVGQSPTSRHSVSFVGFRDLAWLWGGQPQAARFTGTLHAPTSGAYNFELGSTSPALLLVDGKVVVNRAAPAGAPIPTPGSVDLEAGPHAVEIRYAWQGGVSQLEWWWTPPGGERELVPTSALEPAQRSWPAQP